VGLAIAIVSLGAVIGLSVLRFLAPPFEEPLEQLVFATGIGLGIIAYATLGLGLLGLFYGWALTLLLGLLALAARGEWTHPVRLLREAWASSQWREPLERYNINSIIIERDSTFATLLTESPNWQQVYADELAAVFVRK